MNNSKRGTDSLKKAAEVNRDRCHAKALAAVTDYVLAERVLHACNGEMLEEDTAVSVVGGMARGAFK